MRYRVTFVAGFAVGFIVGARAGRERYEQIKKVARRVIDNPAVQQAAGALSGQAGELAQTARQKVGGQTADRCQAGGTSGRAMARPTSPRSGAPDIPPARH